eukprot:5795935-Prymnesium_polylepis.1
MAMRKSAAAIDAHSVFMLPGMSMPCSRTGKPWEYWTTPSLSLCVAETRAGPRALRAVARATRRSGAPRAAPSCPRSTRCRRSARAAPAASRPSSPGRSARSRPGRTAPPSPRGCSCPWSAGS